MLARTNNMVWSPTCSQHLANCQNTSKNMNKSLRSNRSTSKKTSSLKNSSKSLLKITKLTKIKQMLSNPNRSYMLLKSSRCLVKAIGVNLAKLSMISYWSNMSNNTEILKMQCWKIQKDDLDLSRGKWKISMRSLERCFLLNGVWTVCCSMSSAQSPEFTWLKS